MFIGVKNWFYRSDNKNIQLSAFVRALLSALEPYSACAATASGWSSQLHGFGLCQNDLSQVHVATRFMQRGHRWVFIFYFFCWVPLPRGSRPGLNLFSAPTWRIVGVHRTAWVFCFGDFLHPTSGKFPQQAWGTRRTQQAPWGLG